MGAALPAHSAVSTRVHQSVLGAGSAQEPGWAPANGAPEDTQPVATRAGREDSEERAWRMGQSTRNPQVGAAPLPCEFPRSHLPRSGVHDDLFSFKGACGSEPSPMNCFAVAQS